MAKGFTRRDLLARIGASAAAVPFISKLEIRPPTQTRFGFFLVPVREITERSLVTGLLERRTEAVGRRAAQHTDGWRQTWMHIDPGAPFALMVVQAARFEALQKDARVQTLAIAPRLVHWLDGGAPVIWTPQLQTRLQRLAIPSQGIVTPRDLYGALARRLEPALTDHSFESVIVSPASPFADITDDFAGTGAMTASWTEQGTGGSSTPTAKRVSGAIQAQAIYRNGFWFRNDGSFPDDQYAELHSIKQAGDFNVCIAATRCSTTGGGAGYATEAWSSGIFAFKYWAAGSPVSVTDITGGAFTTGNTYLVRLTSTGTSHQLASEGTNYGSAATDSHVASGAPGFYIHWGGDSLADVATDFASTGVSGGGATFPAAILQNIPLKGGG